MLWSPDPIKKEDKRVHLNNSNKENSLSKFDVLSFSFKDENYFPESSNKNINRIKLSSRKRENNSFLFLNHKRTSNFNTGLSFENSQTDLDFYSQGNFHFYFKMMILISIFMQKKLFKLN